MPNCNLAPLTAEMTHMQLISRGLKLRCARLWPFVHSTHVRIKLALQYVFALVLHSRLWLCSGVCWEEKGVV